MTATKVLSIILGVLLIIAGITMIFIPAQGDYFIVIFASIAMIAEGIGSICAYGDMKKIGQADGWTLAGGIISLIVGLILLFGGLFAKAVFLTIFLYFILAWLVIIGIMRIAGSLKLRKFVKDNDIKHPVVSWGWVLFIGILCVIVGVLIIFQPQIGFLTLGIFVGIGIASCGLSLMVAALSH